jgi:ribosomal subunit interface protein
MDVRVKASDYEISPEVSAYLNERLAHIEKLLADDAELARCEVEIGRDAGRPRHGSNIWFAEIQISYPGGNLIRATNRSESINGAIDDVKEEVERQLRKEKRLHRRFLKKGGAALKRLLRWGSE